MTTSRVPAGVHTGGQFAVGVRPEPRVELTAAVDPPFGDIVVKGRGATTSAVVGRIDDIEIWATIRVSHAERGYYTGSVVRRAHDAHTGETIMAPHALIGLHGTGDSTTGRFSEKALLAATETLRDRLLSAFADGSLMATRALTPELNDRDREYAHALAEKRRPRF